MDRHIVFQKSMLKDGLKNKRCVSKKMGFWCFRTANLLLRFRTVLKWQKSLIICNSIRQLRLTTPLFGYVAAQGVSLASTCLGGWT